MTFVLLFYIISILFGLLGILLIKSDVPYFYALVILPVVILLMFGVFLGRLQVYSSPDNGVLIKKAYGKKNGAVLNTMLMYKGRFLEVFVDFLLIFVAYLSAFCLIHGYRYSMFQDIVIRSFPVIVIVKLTAFMGMRLYRGIWQYLGINDLIRVFKATAIGSIAAFFILKTIPGLEDISVRILIVDWMVLILLMEIVRGLERMFALFFSTRADGKKVLIFGAGDAGVMVLKEIRNNANLNYRIEGFLDDDYRKKGKSIDGIKILGGRSDIPKIVTRKGIHEILVAVLDAPEELMTELAGICAEYDVVCKGINKLVT